MIARLFRRLFRRIFQLLLLLCLCALVYAVSHYQRTSAARPEDQYAGTVSSVISSVDRDQDGIDDQTDILQGALAYVQTKPKYKSRYYAGGYPDDGYGVCTDVVANALKAAGYDLMTLVSEDISSDQNAYGITIQDQNIDFRRVTNLLVYFKRHAVQLTTDLTDLEAWQGGDIVVFENHIGIVSDRRNRRGMPYVIHHNSPWQKRYEQDILEKWGQVLGHFRMSE